MLVLGIETSCDETAAAVVNDRGDILSNVILSQLDEHKLYGGVVPEIAARAHLDHLTPIIQESLKQAGTTFDKLDGVAATCGPGLIGGVMIGMMSAKAIASVQNIPFIAVNHLEGHVLTARLSDKVEFPYLVLLVSGGHTQILVAEALGVYKRWGTTLDDAAGECFDKCAKLMGLPYPGGPNVEKMALSCTSPENAVKRFPLPSPMKGRKNCDFSFSGLKTAVRTHVDKLPAGTLARNDVIDLCYTLQSQMAKIMSDRLSFAINQFLTQYTTKQPTLVVCGGVAANQAIAQELKTLTDQYNMTLNTPPLRLSGDNGAMIAWAGIERLKAEQTDAMNFKARPRWPLDPTAEPKVGAGVKA